MLSTGKANLSDVITQKWSVVLSNYHIPSWAYDAMSFCLEADIITPTELNGYILNGNPQPATREQAARILGKTLKHAAPAYNSTATDTTFADNAKISDYNKSYVALLEEKGVISGDGMHRFNPQKTLNRAETAVLVTKIYDLLARSNTFYSGTPVQQYTTGSFVTGTTTTPITTTTNTATTTTAKTKTGKIKTLTKQYLNLEGDSGSYFFDTARATVILVDDERYSVDELVTLWQSKPVLKAALTISGNSTITRLEIEKSSSIKSSDLKGEIKSLSKSKIKIGTKTFNIEDEEDITIKIDNKTKDFDDLMDAYKDKHTTVKATLTLDSDDYVIKIVATTDDKDDDGGELTGINTISNDADYEGYIRVNGKTYYIEDIDDISIKLDGRAKTFAALYDRYHDLKKDEYIDVDITLDKNDYVTKIVATLEDDSKSGDEEGEITDISKSKIELDDDESYDLDDDVDIDVTDGETTIEDIRDLIDAFKDDKIIEVDLTLKSGDVTKIKGEVTEVGGRLISCTSKYIKLEFDHGDETKYKFEDDDIDVTFRHKSSIRDLEDFVDEGFDEDDDIWVTLTLEDGLVVELEAEED